jgi:hypothetical protein
MGDVDQARLSGVMLLGEMRFLCSRFVVKVTSALRVSVPTPLAWLSADWYRDRALRLALQASDVEELALAALPALRAGRGRRNALAWSG